MAMNMTTGVDSRQLKIVSLAILRSHIWLVQLIQCSCKYKVALYIQVPYKTKEQVNVFQGECDLGDITEIPGRHHRSEPGRHHLYM